jgi:DNA ligase D-like protein (predicted ligase)
MEQQSRKERMRKAGFIPPMLLLQKRTLPEGPVWRYELKHDGYRAIAFRSDGKLFLRSRNNRDFADRFREILAGLAKLPKETVIDGEVVALDESGRPSFNALQDSASGARELVYYVYDLMVLAGKDVTAEPFERRRELLEKKTLPKLKEPVRYSSTLKASLPDLVGAVKTTGLEGLVAKRADSPYEPGLRTGKWQKMRINQAQEFVIGGYTVGGATFDALIFGYFEEKKLVYAARTRNGFTPAVRAGLLKKLRPLQINECPFANLPEKKQGRWGQGLTAEKMVQCRWVKPVLVGQFEFLEWTGENHLRHSRFVALRQDKKAHEVVRET